MIERVECERCSGTGELICNRCGGTGLLPGFATWGGGFTSCDVCYGSGYITCLECNGDGYIEKDDEWDDDNNDDWEEDDNGSVFNESNNSPLPITGKHSVIHTNTSRTYTINNKEYLLTNHGFRREHNGNIYRFPYEKSMELIKNGQAVSTNEVIVQYHPVAQVETDSKSNDVVSIDINSETVEKITYEYHNKRVTTYNKSGHIIRHWGVPYSLFLDYVNSNHHYEFRKKYFAEYGPKIRETHRDDFIFSQFHDSDIDDLLIENEIVPITIQEIKPDGTILHIGGIRLISSNDYTWDNIRGYRLNEDIEFVPYTPRTAYYEDKDYGYWFLVSKSLNKQQLNTVYELFDHRGIAWFEDQIF